MEPAICMTRLFPRPAGPTGRRRGRFPDGLPYNSLVVKLALLAAAMGASAVVWCLVRAVDAHIRRLRRPTYYEKERARRAALSAERRKVRNPSSPPVPTTRNVPQ